MDANWLTSSEAAKKLGVSPQRVSQLIRSGFLTAEMVGGRWVVDGASVDDRLRTSSPRGGRPRIGQGRDKATFSLMNRTHEVCSLVYNRRRREFTHVGGFADVSRAPSASSGEGSCRMPHRSTTGGEVAAFP